MVSIQRWVKVRWVSNLVFIPIRRVVCVKWLDWVTVGSTPNFQCVCIYIMLKAVDQNRTQPIREIYLKNHGMGPMVDPLPLQVLSCVFGKNRNSYSLSTWHCGQHIQRLSKTQFQQIILTGMPGGNFPWKTLDSLDRYPQCPRYHIYLNEQNDADGEKGMSIY